MAPMPFAKLFRSRWSALLWAGGILWTAYDVADSAPHPAPVAAKSHGGSATEDATGATVHDEDLALLANLAGATGN